MFKHFQDAQNATKIRFFFFRNLGVFGTGGRATGETSTLAVTVAFTVMAHARQFSSRHTQLTRPARPRTPTTDDERASRVRAASIDVPVRDTLGGASRLQSCGQFAAAVDHCLP